MRVIAGKYKGKVLKEFEFSTTKPTLDRVKESMFNLIQFDVCDAVVLDLFSGTGSLGIESLSRGAKEVYFVDNNDNAISLIKKNLLNIDGKFQLVKSNYLDFLQTINKKFDIVLLDPPFATDFGIKAIDYLIKNNLMNDNGIILFETNLEHKFDFNYENWNIVKKKYGTVAVYKIEKLILD